MCFVRAVPRCARIHAINIPLLEQTAVTLVPELTGWHLRHCELLARAEVHGVYALRWTSTFVAAEWALTSARP